MANSAEIQAQKFRNNSKSKTESICFFAQNLKAGRGFALLTRKCAIFRDFAEFSRFPAGNTTENPENSSHRPKRALVLITLNF